MSSTTIRSLVLSALASLVSSPQCNQPDLRNSPVNTNHATADAMPAPVPTNTCRVVWYPRYTLLHATAAATTTPRTLTPARSRNDHGLSLPIPPFFFPLAPIAPFFPPAADEESRGRCLSNRNNASETLQNATNCAWE